MEGPFRLRFAICILILGFVSFNLCRTKGPNTDIPLVGTSIFPLYDIIDILAEDSVDLFYAVPAGANPHTFNPIPSLVRKLNTVDMFIASHPHLDAWVESYIEETETLHYVCQDHDSEHTNHRSGPDHSVQDGDNPHRWLSVREAAEIAGRVAEALISVVPEDSSLIRKRMSAYSVRLDSLDRVIESLFRECKERRFIQWHPAWDFFAYDYGLQIAGTIERGHGDEPSVREFNDLIRHARTEGIRTIVIGLHVESKAAEALAREIDGNLISLDTIGDPNDPNKDSYVNLMISNAQILSDALHQN